MEEPDFKRVGLEQSEEFSVPEHPHCPEPGAWNRPLVALLCVLGLGLYGLGTLSTWDEHDPRVLAFDEAKDVAVSTLVDEDDRRAALFMIRRHAEELIAFVKWLAAEDGAAADEARVVLEILRQMLSEPASADLEPSGGDVSGK